MKRCVWLLPALLLAVVFCQGCAAPVFSDFQTARIAQQGEWELTPVVSHLPTLDQTNAGLQAALGVGSNVELRARYVRAFTSQLIEDDTRFFGHHFDNLDEDFNTVSFGAKFGLVEGNLAMYAPLEAVFAAGSEIALTTRPTLIATVPLTRFAELNTSVNAILPYGLVSVNAGLGIGSLGVWSVRPEAGVVLNTGYVAAGVGLAYRFGGPK